MHKKTSRHRNGRYFSIFSPSWSQPVTTDNGAVMEVEASYTIFSIVSELNYFMEIRVDLDNMVTHRWLRSVYEVGEKYILTPVYRFIAIINLMPHQSKVDLTLPIMTYHCNCRITFSLDFHPILHILTHILLNILAWTYRQ